MKKIPNLVIAVFLGLMLALTVPISAQASDSEAPFILVLKKNSKLADVEKAVSAAGGELLFWFPEVDVAAARSDSANFAASVKKKSIVQDVGVAGRWSVPQELSPNPALVGPTANDDLYFLQWDMRRIGADMAWDDGVTGSHDTVVSIIDTGVDATHPDLAPNVVFQDCMQLAGPCPQDTLTGFHGTHVAGTVAAAFDGGRVVGVGPDLGVAGYQVFEPGGGGAWDPVIFWAILDTAANGFDVINMSLGGYYQFPGTQGDGAAVWNAWKRVINYATQMGVTIVASAGNGTTNVNGAIYHIPGDIPGVINVSATAIRPEPIFPQADFFDVPAFYTNYGAAIDITAPGGDVGPDYLEGGGIVWEYAILNASPGGYTWSIGTSMASPHVAGAAGLVKDVNPDLNPKQVRAILKRSADKIGSRQLYGSGMLNVYEAVKAAGK